MLATLQGSFKVKAGRPAGWRDGSGALPVVLEDGGWEVKAVGAGRGGPLVFMVNEAGGSAGWERRGEPAGLEEEGGTESGGAVQREEGRRHAGGSRIIVRAS